MICAIRDSLSLIKLALIRFFSQYSEESKYASGQLCSIAMCAVIKCFSEQRNLHCGHWYKTGVSSLYKGDCLFNKITEIVPIKFQYTTQSLTVVGESLNYRLMSTSFEKSLTTHCLSSRYYHKQAVTLERSILELKYITFVSPFSFSFDQLLVSGWFGCPLWCDFRFTNLDCTFQGMFFTREDKKSKIIEKSFLEQNRHFPIGFLIGPAETIIITGLIKLYLRGKKTLGEQ